ncbi:MAG: S-layer homology domain-containing protein [Nitriliruptoraceae bacterium]
MRQVVVRRSRSSGSGILRLASVAMAAVLAVGAARPAAAQPSAAWDVGEACPDAVVVGAAGSGQREPVSELGMGPQVDGLFRAIARVGEGRDIRAVPLAYPAAPVLPTAGYRDSVARGIEAMAAAVADIAAACPGTGIVLAGYSQGAQVVQRWLEDPDAGVGADPAASIDAVVLLASPVFTYQPPLTAFGSFDPARVGLLGVREVPGWIARDTVTWCERADLVCQLGDPRDRLALGAAISGSVHAAYDDPATRRVIASHVVARLDGVPAPPSAAVPGPPEPGTEEADASDGPIGPAVVSDRMTAEQLAREVAFPVPADAGGSTHRGAIARVLAAGVMSGYADGTFGPGDRLTRGQAATVLAGAFELSTTGLGRPFTDTDGSVHAGAIAAAARAGLVDGYPDGTFRPGRTVTRAQLASMLAGGLGLRPPYDPTWDRFDDVAADNVHRQAIMVLARLGLIAGVPHAPGEPGADRPEGPSRTFSPERPVTRGQAASLVARSVLQRLASDPGRHLWGVWERWDDDAYCTGVLVAPNPFPREALAVQQVEDRGEVAVEWLGGPEGGLVTSCQQLGGEAPVPFTIALWVQPDAVATDPDTWAGGDGRGEVLTWLRRHPA